VPVGVNKPKCVPRRVLHVRITVCEEEHYRRDGSKGGRAKSTEADGSALPHLPLAVA
jgi:hypothetical protein